MTASIRSYPEYKRNEVVARRLRQNTMGLGWWAAKDYERKMIGRAKAKIIAETLENLGKPTAERQAA